MTIEELERSLPSGFHDALIHRLSVDYVARTAALEVDIDVGDPEAAECAERERKRRACVTLEGLIFLVVESPDSAYPYGAGKPLWGDTAPIVRDSPGVPRLPALPAGAFEFCVFVNQWNAFMYLAGTHVSLEWAEVLNG